MKAEDSITTYTVTVLSKKENRNKVWRRDVMIKKKKKNDDHHDRDTQK